MDDMDNGSVGDMGYLGGDLSGAVSGSANWAMGGGLESDVQNDGFGIMAPNTVNGVPIERLLGDPDPIKPAGGAYYEPQVRGLNAGQSEMQQGNGDRSQSAPGMRSGGGRGGGGTSGGSGTSGGAYYGGGPPIQLPDASKYLPTASGIAGLQSGIQGAVAGLDPEMIATLKALGISESGTADQLIGAGMGGALPAGYQGVVNQQLGREQADTNRTFGAMGLGSSTMAAQAREGAYGHAAATEVGIRDQLLKAGMSEQQASAQATQAAGALNAQQVQLNLEAQKQQQALMSELDSMATNLYHMETTIPGVRVLTPNANLDLPWPERLAEQLGRPLDPGELAAAKAQDSTRQSKDPAKQSEGLGFQGTNF